MATPIDSITEDLSPLLQRATVVALGPGLSSSQWSQQLIAWAIQTSRKARKPMILDAGALDHLALERQYEPQWILTPHPGEAARLLATSAQAVQADRITAIKQLQAHYGGVMVLKGPGTLISDGRGPIYLCDAGNPGMATGGMGDVLTGIIAGLLAQKLSLLTAACLATLLHSHAADTLAWQQGERGILAHDLLRPLKTLLNP
jgi:NAD(P)H-hydrate epimerase